MGRNYLAERSVAEDFAHFRNGPNDAIGSHEVRPVFDNLSHADQERVRAVVIKHDPRGGNSEYEAIATTLDIPVSVAYGLMILLHPEA
jgi:hypothetical protein